MSTLFTIEKFFDFFGENYAVTKIQDAPSDAYSCNA